MKNKKLWHYSGVFLVITGILHSILSLAVNRNIYLEIIKEGIINEVSKDYARAFSFWFLICGIVLIFFGQVLHYYQKKEGKPAPLFLGYNLLVFAVIGCFFVPISGFWFFIPQALIIIFANRKTKSED